VVEILDGDTVSVEVVQNAPHEEGGCMRPVLMFAGHNADAIVVEGVGGRPLKGFNQVGIEVLAGTGADVQTAVAAYIQGILPVVGLEGACRH
jgi:predicted Fe-Mo cluster-binding NifX family protein